MSEELVLDLDTASGGPDPTGRQRCLTLSFAYSDSDAPWIPSRLRGEHGPLALGYDFLCHGYDLNQFAEALRRMQAGDIEPAAFSDQSGEVRVTLTWADRDRGQISVVAALEMLLPTTIGADRQMTVCRIGGFGVEQSYLREMASDIDRFLAFWDLPQKHPMLR